MHSRLPSLSALLFALALLIAGPAQAQEQDKRALAQAAQQWLQQQAQALAARAAAPLRMQVQVGEPDARLRLAPCAQFEPFLPAGAQAWGATRVGLRCTDGVARWSVTLPAQVQAWGNAWVVQVPIASGTPIESADIAVAEVDWAAQTDAILAERSQWIGQVAARPLVMGQALRRSMVRPAQVFAAGASVRVVAQGPGFSVATEAQALGPGVVGQSVRLRLDNGRIASGTVVDTRTVQVDM
ncbi:MAG: flagellar basal body P-ring formation chaperone FlgA [Rhodoferax sp.]